MKVILAELGTASRINRPLKARLGRTVLPRQIMSIAVHQMAGRALPFMTLCASAVPLGAAVLSELIYVLLHRISLECH